MQKRLQNSKKELVHQCTIENTLNIQVPVDRISELLVTTEVTLSCLCHATSSPNTRITDDSQSA